MSLQTISAEDRERFTTTNPREVLFYLNQLVNDAERVSVIFDAGQETFLTLLLDIDTANNRLIFDWGGSEALNQKLLQSATNHFVCAPLGVKNQFTTGIVREVTFRNRPAFATGLPKSYTRLQRREFFRLQLPITRRPTCQLAVGTGKTIEVPVVDISIGGVAIEAPGSALSCVRGNKFSAAVIRFKDGTRMVGDLEVRNTAEVRHGDKVALRVGCHFVKLTHAMENQLQRFIIDVQREERARLGS